MEMNLILKLIVMIIHLIHARAFFASSSSFTHSHFLLNSFLKDSTYTPHPPNKLPVTIISGFLGSGKTTLLRHILTNNHLDKKYAVIVNDMNEVNIDASLIKPFMSYPREELVEMSNGCICCTLREDLLKEVVKLAREHKYDHLIIESTGISEPMPVAETFTFSFAQSDDGIEVVIGDDKDHDHDDEDHEHDHNHTHMKTIKESDVSPNSEISSVQSLVEVDSMVTLVDAVNFLHDIKSAEDLQNRNLGADENDARTITDLLVSQVEFATIVIINKCDLVDSDRILDVKKMIRALNHDAKIIESTRSVVDIAEIIGSKSYDFDKVSQSPAWLKAISDTSEKIPETEEYGISSFVYRARKPFHPARLMSFINTAFPASNDGEIDEDYNDEGEIIKDEGIIDSNIPCIEIGESNILRSKGFYWLSSIPQHMMIWSQAGGLFEFSPSNLWWCNTPRDQWPEDSESVSQIMADFDGDVGDKRQELVFIGTDIEKEKIITSLNNCLLTDEEMNTGESAWRDYSNPFASISYQGEEN